MFNNMCNNCDNIGNNVVLLGALIAQNLLSMAATVNDCQIICEKEDSSKNTNDTSNNTNNNTDINNNNTIIIFFKTLQHLL